MRSLSLITFINDILSCDCFLLQGIMVQVSCVAGQVLRASTSSKTSNLNNFRNCASFFVIADSPYCAH